MTPLWKQRLEPQPAANPWRAADQRTRFPKCPNAAPRHVLPSYTYGSKNLRPPAAYRPLENAVIGSYGWEEPVVSRVNGYHGRHAEASPVRPRIVTVVRPCGEHNLRKISLLLNRRAVQTFELLIADVSEALGFPSWSNGRVRRLFSPTGREIRSLSDFFHFDQAFLAFGSSRPLLGEVQAALEELYPDSPGYCGHLLRLWERILRHKAAKADSGFHDDDPQVEASQNITVEPTVNQPVANNLQPTRAHARQKDRGRRERQRGEWEHWRVPLKAPMKEEKGRGREEERKKESVYCRSCRGAGPPIPPIRQGNRQCAKWESPNNQSKAPPSQNDEMESQSQQQQQKTCEVEPNTLNPINNSNLPQNHQNIPIPETQTEKSPADQDRPKAKLVKQTDWQQQLPPDGVEVSHEEIERCYEIGSVVGDGNFAVVRECRVRGSTQTFAMKMVDKAKLQGRGHMIQNEIALLRSLAHPRLVQLLRSHHTDTYVYLLMELVTGGDLFDAIARSGRFSEPCAARMIRDISQALEYIHNKSIAHRDIKPENLLVQHNGNGSVNLKLADFGLAMVVTEPVYTVCGTPTYVAPEILAETGYGVAVDVWAMGVILFVLLSGFPPFRSAERNQEELFGLIQKGEVHFISPYWDHVSEGAKALIRALLEVNPAVRLTASQTLQNSWLLHAASQSGHTGETTNNQPKPASRKDAVNHHKQDISAETGQSAQNKDNKHTPQQNTEINTEHTDPQTPDRTLPARETSKNSHIQEIPAQPADPQQNSATPTDLHHQEEQSHNTEIRTNSNHQISDVPIISRNSDTDQNLQDKPEESSDIKNMQDVQ
ncbi:serine/threonine-protein kinase DCLK3 [Astyanax mexicanus]|uniref:non-specific serine/threonine protein kinase n=2 Tax=Astyanax mexicanus TaxID=7994 RepID=A0A8T2M6W9_ASTMX|nr:serine/threonine-protein kinase DCLK3 [Astyanax mexicanus]